MKLSILIPTYNRSKFLLKNLESLKSFIFKLKKFHEIEIIVSNNCSTDNTDQIITSYLDNYPDLKLRYFSQNKNIGLQKNALFVLNEAQGEYIMYLGDDDFLEFSYLKGVVEYIQTNTNVHCIIPSFVAINTSGESLEGGRDFNFANKLTKGGFYNCFINSWRGHQLSGLVLKREGLYDSYITHKVNNIYLFIYFVAYSCLHGNTYHFTKFPVKVTQPGQENKDWGYGKDGLLNEVFDNYKKLNVNLLQKGLLQLYFYTKQSWRLEYYENLGPKGFFNAFYCIWFSKNSTFFFRLFFPFVGLLVYFYRKMKNILN
ncbi:glycosyltransferase [Flaviramulus sp. BrNp1-15]|uniref:glycosyltransferase family 2 protein n=1 Tax=Flaviramulus sp. BrNp1-15 TaxID=2916754 RepID=UPI001EE90E59|nr:glycosyltransferase family 2 protein [Flaviramulus sp. BrNp1-15]ULC59749.1 glycosyltransferase [Flaviramulus sp. BrNp1-15]